MGTVREDVAFGPANLGLKGAELERRVQHALEQVGMAEYVDRPPHHLSFGQRRRVAVATVLAMEPEILVLDEPSSNLDPASRRELADILRSLDVTVLMVTHDLPYALELCPRSVVLSDGHVVADGSTYDVLTDDALMRAHRLELPFGFDPRTVGARPDGRLIASRPWPRGNSGKDGPVRARARDRGDPGAARRTIDELLYRAHPKTIVSREVRSSRRTSSTRRPASRAPTTSSRSSAGVVGTVVVFALIRKVAR